MKVLQLTQGKVAIVDDEDATGVKWYFEKSTGYAARKPNMGLKKQYLQRFVLERKLGRPMVKGEYADHVNGNRLDNRRINLRVATMSENLVNRAVDKRSTSGVRGVSQDRRNGNWVAYYAVNGKKIHIGSFKTFEEATAARLEVVIKIHGEFFNPN